MGNRTRHRWLLPPLTLAVAVSSACVTPAEFEKVRVKVVKMERAQTLPAGSSSERERVAELAAEIDRLAKTLAKLGGRLDVVEHQAKSALSEARSARSDAAKAIVAAPIPGDQPELPAGDGENAAEVGAYRAAYGAWRSGEYSNCIDQFRHFLQTYPDSAYADDGAFWMADCFFKNGDYKTAVLRFDDVVARYPTGNKAADALYRQGEALLRLGPNYANAAGKAFERVLNEYPDSARVPEAKKQLDLLSSG